MIKMMTRIMMMMVAVVVVVVKIIAQHHLTLALQPSVGRCALQFFFS
jgi:hypothetical protein